jgi:hypothetical protein
VVFTRTVGSSDNPAGGRGLVSFHALVFDLWYIFTRMIARMIEKLRVGYRAMGYQENNNAALLE